MAAFHGRSNSFSSKALPFVSEIEERLERINSSRSASSSSSSEVYNQLNSLQDLHDSVDELLARKAFFTKEQSKKCVDGLLDGSLRLLDLCCVAKDALSQTKESLLELRSTIRRNGVQETECKKYLAVRKSIKKMINKALHSLQKMQTKKSLPLPIEDEEASSVIVILQETEEATLSVFESLFSLISGSQSQSKPNSWSLVSKVLNKKNGNDAESSNEFKNVDSALHKTEKTENAQEKLRDLETCVEDLEESVDRLNRRLIKTRVSLLNILNH